MNIGKKHDDNFRTMIEAAIEYDRPVRIGVNWGSLDGALLTRMMDENNLLAGAAGRARRHAERHRRQRDRVGRGGRALRACARQDHPERQGQRRAGPDHGLSGSGRAVRLRAASRLDRSGHGREGHRRHDGRACPCCCRKASATRSACR